MLDTLCLQMTCRSPEATIGTTQWRKDWKLVAMVLRQLRMMIRGPVTLAKTKR